MQLTIIFFLFHCLKSSLTRAFHCLGASPILPQVEQCRKAPSAIFKDRAAAMTQYIANPHTMIPISKYNPLKPNKKFYYSINLMFLKFIQKKILLMFVIKQVLLQRMNKKEFLTLYDQAVHSLRTLKTRNDALSKEVGLGNDADLYLRQRVHTNEVQKTLDEVCGLIKRMEKGYLDPDSARKIGTVRQQLVLQKDRRRLLMQKIEEAYYNSPQNLQKSIKNFETQGRGAHQRAKNKGPTNLNKRNEVTDTSSQSSNHEVQMFMEGGHSPQIEQKLLRERGENINSAHQRLNNIHKLVNDESIMVHQQGEKLDVIEEELFTTYKNIEMSNDQLQEANKKHLRSRRKYVTCSLIILLVVGVMAFMILAI